MRLGCDLLQGCFTGTSIKRCFTGISSDTLSKNGVQLKWQIFRYSVLAKATNNFDQCNCCGWGDLAKVYYGKRLGHSSPAGCSSPL